MKWITCWLLGLALARSVTHAGPIYYYVDFENPPHQANQVPAAGTGRNSPSQIVFGSPTVVDSYNHLPTQSLLFRGRGYEQISFQLGRGATNYFIEFDFETRNLNPSLFAFTVNFDTPIVQNFHLHGLGWVSAFIPRIIGGVVTGTEGGLMGDWTDNERHHMRIEANLSLGRWTLQIDNTTRGTGNFYTLSGDVQSIRLNLSPWRGGTPDDPEVQVAIDNLIIGSGTAPTSPIISCPSPATLECSSGSLTPLTAHILDSNGSPLTVVWTVDGVAYQTNRIAATGAAISTNVSFTGIYGFGEHDVVVSASNGVTPPVTCSTTVTVRDTQPPEILNVSASPAVLWPPNGRMVPVVLNATARDACGATRCRIIAIRSDEIGERSNEADQVTDWEITGELTANLRAKRGGDSGGRTYTIELECQDEAGNKSFSTANVLVPHDQSDKENSSSRPAR